MEERVVEVVKETGESGGKEWKGEGKEGEWG